MPDVRAVLIVGSRARTDVPADEWSDLDLVLIVDDPATYLDHADWVSAFGRPVVTFIEPTAVGESAERRVLCDGGLDVDFALFSVADMEAHELDADVNAVLRSSMRTLLDEDGIVTRLNVSVEPPPPRPPPTQPAFDQVVQMIEWHAGDGTDTWYGGRFLERWGRPTRPSWPDVSVLHV